MRTLVLAMLTGCLLSAGTGLAPPEKSTVIESLPPPALTVSAPRLANATAYAGALALLM